MKWQGKWIWNDGEASPRNEWWCFRRSLEVPSEGWDRAAITLTADSRYVLYVNGEQVGWGPVRSWQSEQSYDEHEIGHLLHKGKNNTIAVMVLHWGISNFYYIRGRGGLIAQLNYYNNDTVFRTEGTNEDWRTSRHLGQDSRSTRMSCQQGFSERIDARLWDDAWIQPVFDDAGWQQATVIGEAGMAPWTHLIPRDIPQLTEEMYYAARIESLHQVKPVSWTAAIEVRNHFCPESNDRANIFGYTGYIATIIRMSESAQVTFGFPLGFSSFVNMWIDGKLAEKESYCGVDPEKYVQIQLEQGDHLLYLDVSITDHGHGFHIGIDSVVHFELVSPTSADENYSPFIAVGPFDTVEVLDHQPSRELNREDDRYLAAAGISTLEKLASFTEWIHPISNKFVSRDDIFLSSIWKREYKPQSVPAALNNAIIPNRIPAIIPQFERADTEFIIDFGREISGYITFEVEAEVGTTIDFYGYEYMRDGWRQDTFWLDNTLRYVCKQGRQQYKSPVRRGLRYLMVTVRNANKPLQIFGVQMIQSNYPVAEVGRFQSSDALLNDIWKISQHTTRLCMEDTFVDCPAYEQTFWVGDSRNEAIVNNYIFGANEIVKRCLRLVPGSNHQTPLYMDQVPSGWSSVIPNWTFFWAIACHEYYLQTADAEFAKEMWPHIRHTLDHYLQKLDDRGLLFIKGWNLLDWAPIDQPNDGVVTHQNLFLVKTLRETAYLGEIAGDSAGSAYNIAAADRLQKAINQHLWHEEKQLYLDCIHADGRKSTNYSMQTQVIAHLCRVAEGSKKSIMESYMMNPPAEFVQIGSPFMSFFYYEALAEVGKYGTMLNDIRFNYGKMLEYDATTCWEMYPNFAENRANPNMLTRSHCHAWSAAPCYFLGAYVLGVRSAAPGWKEVIVEPQPCGLSWVRGSVPLPLSGRIDVSWKADEEAKTFHLQIWAPKSIKLHIRLPEGYNGTIEQHEM